MIVSFPFLDISTDPKRLLGTKKKFHAITFFPLYTPTHLHIKSNKRKNCFGKERERETKISFMESFFTHISTWFVWLKTVNTIWIWRVESSFIDVVSENKIFFFFFSLKRIQFDFWGRSWHSSVVCSLRTRHRSLLPNMTATSRSVRAKPKPRPCLRYACNGATIQLEIRKIHLTYTIKGRFVSRSTFLFRLL